MPPNKHALFINPWIYDFTAYDFWSQPLGLLTMAAIVKAQTPAQIHFIDCLDRFHPGLTSGLKSLPDGRGRFYKEHVPKPAAVKFVPRRFSRYGMPILLFQKELDEVPRPDMVFLTCGMTYWYPGVQLAVDLLRRKFGGIPIFLGGIYATLCPDHARSESGADRVVCGLGENQILPLVEEVLGDGFVQDKQVFTYSDLPAPAYFLLRNKETLAVMTSRGCPFSCSYCASHLLCPKFEQADPQKFVDFVSRLSQTYRMKNLAFYDDALLINKQRHIFPILEGLTRLKQRLVLHTPNGLHVREIDKQTALALRNAGVSSVFLSQESFDRDLLLSTASAKVLPEDLLSALVHLESAGYRRSDIFVYLLVGLPHQPIQGIRESIQHVLAQGARPLLAYFSLVPGTSEWRYLVELGLLPKDADPLLHNKLASSYALSGMEHRDFIELKHLSLQYQNFE